MSRKISNGSRKTQEIWSENLCSKFLFTLCFYFWNRNYDTLIKERNEKSFCENILVKRKMFFKKDFGINFLDVYNTRVHNHMRIISIFYFVLYKIKIWKFYCMKCVGRWYKNTHVESYIAESCFFFWLLVLILIYL